MMSDSNELSPEDQETALVFLEAWGSGETIDSEAFQGNAYVIRDYAPEWVDVPDDADVITLLTVQVGAPDSFEGYSILESYGVGEKTCPYLEDEEHSEACPLCQGDGILYWGEEWQIVVLTKD
jgi:hypothetical protein